MRELPDLSEIEIAPGDPVTPESLNQASQYADVYRLHFGVEHRVEDFEHAAPLAPAAFGYFRWDGSKYQAIGPTHNIKSVTPNGPGDVTVELEVASRTKDDWFPVVSPRSADGGGHVYWWEYDDGATRSATKCRLRFIHPDFALLAPPEEWTYKDADTDFFFHAYMYRRAMGAAGTGAGSVPEGYGVPHRICVDGVESAQHRQRLIDSCVTHRQRWEREHGPHGEHTQPRYPLAAWQIDRPEERQEEGRIRWQAGPLDELLWSTDRRSVEITWRTRQGRQWRGLMPSIRHSMHDAPLWILDSLATRMPWLEGPNKSVVGYREMGGLHLAYQEIPGDEMRDKEWDGLVSIGGVLTGW
jgi:hypothetical protein